MEKLAEIDEEIRGRYEENFSSQSLKDTHVHASGKLTIKSPFLNAGNTRPTLLPSLSDSYSATTTAFQQTQTQFPYQHHQGEQGQGPSSMQTLEPLFSSTPKSKSTRKRSQEQQDGDNICESLIGEKFFKRSHPPPQPQDIIKEDCVAVITIKWPSCERSKNLSIDLHQLAKNILRGRYDKMAAAVWRHDVLRKHIIATYAKEVNRECERMCQLKPEPSILRKTSKDDMLEFSFEKVDKELSVKAPLLRSVLVAAVLRRSWSPESNGRWLPIVSTAAAICLKGRSKFLTAIQLLISTIIQHSSYSVSILLHEYYKQ